MKKQENIIEAREMGKDKWELSINGRKHTAQFVSLDDVREWVGAMQAHGLYEGYTLFAQRDSGQYKKVLPTYNHPVKEQVAYLYGRK